MNIFCGESGQFLGDMVAETLPACERLIVIELNLSNSVELFRLGTNEPVSNYDGKIISTDSDGFCRIKMEKNVETKLVGGGTNSYVGNGRQERFASLKEAEDYVRDFVFWEILTIVSSSDN